MPKPKKGLRKKLFACFLAIILINLIGEAVIYYHNELILDYADESQEDLAVEIRISAYLNGVREISSGLFMLASGRKGMGQSAVLQAELELEELEQFFDDVDWEHFLSDKQDFFRCVEIKRRLLDEASRIASLIARRDDEASVLTAEDRAHLHAGLELSLARAATLTEHADLYIAKLTEVLETHTAMTTKRGHGLINRVRIAVFTTSVLLTAVALFVAGLFSRSLSRRVVALELIAREFGRGDLSRRADARGNDELSALARSFNRMADDLQFNIDLRLSKEYVENIVDTMTNGLIVLNPDKRIERINRAACELFGYPPGELIGQHIADVLPVDCSDDARARLAPLSRGEVSRHIEFELATARGRIIPVLISSAPMPTGDGDAYNTVCIIEDITSRRELIDELVAAKKRAEQAAASKTAFLANMSHELRTPLNGILGYVQILKADKGLSDKQHDALDTMRQSGHHLLTLLDDLLDLSKIEADRMELHPTEFHLPKFLTGIADIFRVRAQQKGVQFYYETLVELPTAVRGDAKRIRQVLINLLGNAIKFTDRGGVIFKVGTHEGKMRFQVEDTGAGIAPDELEAIFSPFQQSGTRTTKAEGTGLGLSISRRLVEMMGGQLKVRSVVGKGSVFWMDLDLPVAEGWIEPEVVTPRAVIGYDGPRRKILIVDDKAENRSVLTSMLSPLDFHLSETSNGQEAIERMKAFRPHAILMDVKMPVMDGLTATEQIRALPEFADVVILAVSASAFGEDRERSVEAGCNGFLTKPLRFEELLEHLERHLGLSWIYEDAPIPVQTSDDAFVVPPADQVKTLLDMAMRGDIKAIRRNLDQLEATDASYGPFITELRKLAKLYRVKQIRELLKQHLAGS